MKTMEMEFTTGRGGGFSAYTVVEREELPVLSLPEFRAEVARRNENVSYFDVGDAQGYPRTEGAVMIRLHEGLIVAFTHAGHGHISIEDGFVLDPEEIMPLWKNRDWRDPSVEIFAPTREDARRVAGFEVKKTIPWVVYPKYPLDYYLPSQGRVICADGRVRYAEDIFKTDDGRHYLLTSSGRLYIEGPAPDPSIFVRAYGC